MTAIGPEKDQAVIEAKIRAALKSEPRLGFSFHLRQIVFEDDGSLVLDGEVPSPSYSRDGGVGLAGVA
jgi:hypothetical protein